MSYEIKPLVWTYDRELEGWRTSTPFGLIYSFRNYEEHLKVCAPTILELDYLAFPTAKKMKEVVWKRYQQAMEQWLVEVVKP